MCVCVCVCVCVVCDIYYYLSTLTIVLCHFVTGCNLPVSTAADFEPGTMDKEQRANGKFTYQNIVGDSAGGWAEHFQQIRYAIAPTLACHEVSRVTGCS